MLTRTYRSIADAFYEPVNFSMSSGYSIELINVVAGEHPGSNDQKRSKVHDDGANAALRIVQICQCRHSFVERRPSQKNIFSKYYNDPILTYFFFYDLKAFRFNPISLQIIYFNFEFIRI